MIAPNLGLDLDFIDPSEHNGVKIQCIETVAIQTKVEFWRSSVACFILGLTPSPGYGGISLKIMGKQAA